MRQTWSPHRRSAKEFGEQMLFWATIAGAALLVLLLLAAAARAMDPRGQDERRRRTSADSREPALPQEWPQAGRPS
ncbi:hypothetical protein ACIA8C_20970 [Nocardia sp. NPDC051321]|uniref:hypothetical protein n=1 Tax=Nocardia sp. NPDC051321 TaxID=3364323 RepID=UPI00379DD1E4